MSEANFVIEGFAAEPKQRFSQAGKSMLDISVAHSPRRKNRDTGEWEDVVNRSGQKVTVWARATFFGDQADFLATQVQKGTYVRLEGEPRVNAYLAGNDPAANIEIQFAKLSIIPRQQRAQGGSGVSGQSGWHHPAPADSQGFTGPSSDFGSFDDPQPF